jgi:hypothetical protein
LYFKKGDLAMKKFAIGKRFFCGLFMTLVFALGAVPLCFADQYDNLLMSGTDAEAFMSKFDSRIQPHVRDNYNKYKKIYVLKTPGDLQILQEHAINQEQYIYVIDGRIDMGGTTWRPPYRAIWPFNGALIYNKGAAITNKNIVADGEGSFLGIMGENGFIYNENDCTLTTCGRFTEIVEPVLDRIKAKIYSWIPCCNRRPAEGQLDTAALLTAAAALV